MNKELKNIITGHFRKLDKRIIQLEKFIEELKDNEGFETKIDELDYKELKHLLYMIECQKERLERFVDQLKEEVK